jgi:hypothetical protein
LQRRAGSDTAGLSVGELAFASQQGEKQKHFLALCFYLKNAILIKPNFRRRISPQRRKDRKEKESPQRHREHGEDYKD